MKRLYGYIMLMGCLLALPLQARQQDRSQSKAVVRAFHSEETPPLEITVYEHSVKVVNAPVGSVLEVYSVVGIKVKEIEMKQSSGEYYINLAKGYYIIRIGDVVRKIAIR